MAILERRAGCAPDDLLCEGPVGPYWTFFETPIQLLWMHALGALVLVGLVLAGYAVVARRRRSRVTWRALGVAAGGWVGGFVLLAALFPVTVNY